MREEPFFEFQQTSKQTKDNVKNNTNRANFV